MSQAFSERVKKLNLPHDDTIVVGSGILDQLGIRKASDIDLVVTPNLYGNLRAHGEDWVEREVRSSAFCLEHKQVSAEIWLDLPGKSGELNFDQLMGFTEEYDGIRFISLEFARDWKTWRGRPKDVLDIKLIDDYSRERRNDT